MRKISCILASAAFLTLALSVPAWAQAHALNGEFSKKLDTLVWVAYSPTNFNPERNQYPTEENIRKDLAVLAAAGFNGVVTYGSQSTLGEIPRIAREAGFKGVIMGIWDINSEEETANAVFMADYVDAYCVGNEGLFRRYQIDDVTGAIESLKKKTGKPATTTEAFSDYSRDTVMAIGDWVFPNIHPFLSHVKTASTAADWISKHYRVLKRNAERFGKTIIFKEVGCPTRGDTMTSRTQKDFFQYMEKTNVRFVYFEAFDQFWKRDTPVEPYWGLFDRNRRPKAFIKGRIREHDAVSKPR